MSAKRAEVVANSPTGGTACSIVHGSPATLATAAPAPITIVASAGVIPIPVTPLAVTSAVIAPTAVPATVTRDPAVVPVVRVVILVGIGRVKLRRGRPRLGGLSRAAGGDLGVAVGVDSVGMDCPS
jgi:hypothetical protein